MTKKLTLDDDFYLREATIYGLVSELPDHRLCYILNQAMNLRLCRTKYDREAYSKRGTFLYSEYEFDDPERQMLWLLTSNRKGRQEATITSELKDSTAMLQSEVSSIPLVPDLKMIDYFLWYEGTTSPDIDSIVNESLKKLPHVRTFQKINIESSKHIQNLLLEY